MSKIYGAWKGYKESKELGRQNKSSSMENLVRQAQLAESGYDVKPTFGGGVQLVPRQGFESSKDLDKKLKQEQLLDYQDPTRMAKRFRALSDAFNQNGQVATQTTNQSDYEGQPAEGYQEGDMVEDVDDSGVVVGQYQVIGGQFRRI